MKKISFNISKDLNKKLEYWSNKLKTSKSEFARRAIQYYCDKIDDREFEMKYKKEKIR